MTAMNSIPSGYKVNGCGATRESTLGYKQTEVGVIPVDWNATEIGLLNPFITSGSRGWAEFYSDFGSPFIRITNMSRGSIYLDLADLKHVKLPQNATEGKRTQLQNDDVLISITADIGITGFVDGSVSKPAYINQHIALVRFNESSEVDSKFVAYFLASEGAQRRFLSATDQGAKAGKTLGGIRKVQLTLPPLSEQRAIATALSDVDALLAAQDKLIAKKRDIKQAAMQQLLTGKQRLPGFSGEWEVKRLGEIGIFLKGSGVRKDESLSGDLPCIRYGEIYTQHDDYIKEFHSSISAVVAATAKLLKKGDLLFAGSGETKEDIGKCVAFVDALEAYAGGDIVILRPDNADAMFLGYYLNTTPIAMQKASRGQGDAVVHISANSLSQIVVAMPKFEEQTAIAIVLSDMDADLAALEQQRDKTRAVKQGMMQELLTGRIRLV